MKHPQEWKMTLLIGHDALHYRLEHETLEAVKGSTPIGQGERLAAVENAVYDTPEILDDYRDTRVIVTTTRYALTPSEVPAALRESILRATLTGVTGDVLTSDTSWGVGFVYELPRGLRSFIDRTFIMPPVEPHIQGVVDFLHHQPTANVAVHINGPLVDIAIGKNGTLQLANTYHCPGKNDALFYTLQACKATGIDALTDGMMIVGDERECKPLRESLSPYFKHIKMSSNARFPLKSEDS